MNPNDEDCVCDEYENEYVDKFDKLREMGGFLLIVKINQSSNFQKEWYNKTLESYRDLYYYFSDKVEENFNCIKAHEMPKPIEIDLEKEKCVEYAKDYAKDKDYGLIYCGSDYKDYIPKSPGETIPISKKGYDNYCCLKSEPKTECEKGNPDYTIKEIPNTPKKLISCHYDEITSIEKNLTTGEIRANLKEVNTTSIPFNFSYGVCLYEVETECVKRIISDLTCSELKEETSGKNKYCSQLQIGFICFSSWKRSKYGTKDDLLFEYMNRCIND